MRILINSPSLKTSDNVSGISTMTSLIIKKNEVHNYIFFKIGSEDNVNRNLSWLIKFLFSYLHWIKVLLLNKINLIHFNFPLQKFSILRDVPFIICSRIFRRKTLIHLHGGEYLFNENMPFVHNIFLKTVLSFGLPIIVLSTIEENVFRDKYKCKSLFVLPNAVEINDSIVDREKNEFINLLFMSRIHKSKGLETITDAFKILLSSGCDFTFTLCGDGPDKDWFVKGIKEILGQRLIYKGLVSGEEKNSIISEADIFLLPSIYGEGLPIALLETMSKGVIPIVTDDGSILSVVENDKNGIVISKNSPLELSGAIKKLLSNEAFAKTLSKNAIHTISSNYNIEKYISRLNEIYSKIDMGI